MFKEEAKWIRESLAELPLRGCSVANLGSSTAEFRQQIQPHIHRDVVAPLEAAGARVVHIDLKPAAGVDVTADLSAPDFASHFEQGFDLLLCTNMLEHVEDIPTVVDNILRIAAPGACLLLTVPRRYPLHFDPIDSGFRPRPDELAALFQRKTSCRVLRRQVIAIKDSAYYPVRKSAYPLWGYRLRLRYLIGLYYQVAGVLIQIEG